jgi:HPt (histidine-containing phosphotransfer) domain-containing protein
MLGDELNAVFELFIQQMPELMSDICNAQQANDIDALKAAAHTLKGSASSLGALRLAELCRQLQDQQDMQNLELIALVAEAKKVTESLAERLEKYMLSGLHD